ncbi:MAG: hypothetical protein DMD67_13560 [Gemmatimonadetes bacterium]|nr:MAG: hypothetical protein DMD67_13560 [Gemmatimonadota bacterium]
MMDREPVMTSAMYLPSALAPEPLPLPFATKMVRPSGDAATAVGYQPTGMRPATRISRAPIRTTATALLPAMATYSVRRSSRTSPVVRSTRATPFAPASAANSAEPESASAEGCGPTNRDWRTAGRSDKSITETVESPQLLTYRCAESATAV